jgi:hypothetical protein
MELGQEGWLKQPVAKARGPIMASDQESRQGHQCSEIMLIGDPSSRSVGASPGRTAAPQAGSKWLTRWTSETV